MKLLITGATGFIGQNLCVAALVHNYSISATMRPTSNPDLLPAGVERISIDSVATTLPENALANVDVVIHLAARVHVMKDVDRDPLTAYRQINTIATLSLARQAAEQGVKRFIYVSSIKVNGEGSARSYTEQDPAEPGDPYGQSKWEAEQGLKEIATATGLEIVIIRPPLVYGAKVKGNLQQLLKAIESGLPLPLGAVQNRRSLVYVGNLVDAILTCVSHPAAKNQTFLISDGEDLSTPELIRRLAARARKIDGNRAKLFTLIPIPPQLLVSIGKLTGKADSVDKLLGSLTVDSTHIQKTLNWHPPFTVDQGLDETVKC